MPPATDSWRTLSTAALAVLLLLLALGLLLALAPAGMTAKSLQAEGALRLAASSPRWAYAFYAGDGLYALAGFAFFLTLAKVSRGPRALLALGLAAALGKATFDLGENILLAQAVALDAADDPSALALVTALKQLGGGVCALAFALVYPGDGWRARVVRMLLVATGLASLAGLLMPALGQANAWGVFFIAAVVTWDARTRAPV